MNDSAEKRACYKKTKIGWIPADWKPSKIKEIAKVVTGSTPPTADKDNYGDSCLFVSPVDLGKSKYITRTEKMLSMKGLNSSRKIPKGSILFTCIGSTIGKVGIAGQDLVTNQQINSVIPKPDYDNEYVYYSLSSIANRIKQIAGEQAVPIVNKSTFETFKIPLPPLPEQRKIAQILSTWDKAIELTEKLIAAKKRRKKGLMQQLLTGKRRFRKFSEQISKNNNLPEGWTEVNLGKMAEIQMGTSPSSTSYNDKGSGLPLIQGNADIRDRKTQPAKWTSTVTTECFPGDLIMTVRAPVGKIAKAVHHGCVGRGACVIRADNAKTEFIFQYLLLIENKWNQYAQGSTFTALTGKDIRTLKLFLPSEKELRQIATFLSICDQEIHLLRTKIKNLEQQKKGLMQKLLTGKIRVKIDRKEIAHES